MTGHPSYQRIDIEISEMLRRNLQVLSHAASAQIREMVEAGEYGLAFMGLVDALRSAAVRLDPDSKERLREMADDIGCLEYPSGKGHYW